MFSIICVYNDREILDNYLIKSLDNQNTNYELILVDNSDSKFKSAAEALNYGGQKATGDYLMFVHQDIELLSENWLIDAEKHSNSLKNLGIAGIAGRAYNKGWSITNIKDGIPPRDVSPNHGLKYPTKVQTLDECLIIIPKEIFSKINFDEENCDSWHLYAVDYSLSIKKIGYDVYVLPLPAYHRSRGYSLSKGYYETLKKLLSKHGQDTSVILTTMGDWSINYPLIVQKYYFLFKNKIWTLLKN
ncbi:MAG: family 2 glycosyl transferase [Methanobacteriaceae archaeon]|jgi:glycosyltransferase involved in cell wall biosynthesis|nr:family 2 glycosyl transferase [Methanobacteriaceae archaeon]